MDSLTRGCAIWAAVLGSTLLSANLTSAQEVYSQSVVTSCNGCATDSCSGNTGIIGNGFLSGGRGLIGRHGHFSDWQQQRDHYQQIAEQVAARNNAWPKPFNCADRQLYFSIWEPMIDSGFERNALLGRLRKSF